MREMPSTVIKIISIKQTTGRGVQVIRRDGRAMWLSRLLVDFAPGRAIVPQWLMDKVNRWEQHHSTCCPLAEYLPPPIIHPMASCVESIRNSMTQTQHVINSPCLSTLCPRAAPQTPTRLTDQTPNRFLSSIVMLGPSRSLSVTVRQRLEDRAHRRSLKERTFGTGLENQEVRK